jgi:glycosyltransferase involved in cell wall biosynthesis
MPNDLQIYQVVNSVDPTSVPADIATGLARRDGVRSGIVSWFSSKPLNRNQPVEIACVEADHSFVNRSAYLRAREELRDADVLHTHHNHAGIYAKLLGKDLGIPVIRTEQTTHDRYTRIGRLSNGLSNPLASAVTCVSDTVYDSFTRWEDALLSDSHVRTIPNGVDFDLIEEATQEDWSIRDAADIAANTFVIGHAGRLIEDKDQACLIRAIGLLDGISENVELVIAGDGHCRDELVRLAADLGMSDQIHFVGLLDRREVYQLMQEVDAFSMPSRKEGFCVAVAEALATGTPCLLSDIDVFRELYSEAAHYHDVGDAESLASAIQTLMRDETYRDSLGEEGRKLAESRYALDEVVAAYERLYAELV